MEIYGAGPNYFVLKNQWRGTDFSQLKHSAALNQALQPGVQDFTVGQLQKASMRKIERQRVKNWLKKTYEMFDSVPL